MADTVESILAARREEAQKREADALAATAADDRFYSVIRAEGLTEEFFELRFRNGTRTCLSFRELSWFNYDQEESVIEMGFGLFIVQLKGRGLVPRLFDSIKARRVAWLKEADAELVDTPEFETFIESISITYGASSPSAGAEEEE